MPTYPLTFPSIVPASATFKLSRAVSVSNSPFTFQQQVYKHPGERWEGSVTFPPMIQENAQQVIAFLNSLQGQYGTFLYGDPNYLAQGALGVASGSPLVDGGSQTGGTLNIKNLGTNITDWMKAGDYFQLGTGTAARLYQAIEDVDTDGSGDATINFFPNLVASPADNDAVVVTGAKGLFRLASNEVDWSVGEANIYGISFGFVGVV